MLQWMWFKCRTFWNCFKLWLWFWAHCRACKLPCSSCQHFGWLDTPLTHNGYFTTKNSNGRLPFFYGSFKCLIRLLDSQRSEKWKELEQERFDNAPIEGYNIPNVGAIQTSLSKSSRTSIAFFEVHCWRQLEITWLPGSDLTVSIAVSGLMLSLVSNCFDYYSIGSMVLEVLVYMLTWLGYIDGIHGGPYIAYMDPMGIAL